MSLGTSLHAIFLKSAPTYALCPNDDVAEIAFVGRSNAGKSSALNALTGVPHLARVSKKPGRTQMINFFSVTEGGRLVDLPGYGYASASRSSRKFWSKAVDDYLEKRTNLTAVVLIMDVRHPLKPMDEQFIQWSNHKNVQLVVLLSKSDKLKFGARKQVLFKVQAVLANNHNATVFIFSVTHGIGVEDARRCLRERLSKGKS